MAVNQIDVAEFLKTGFALKSHLADFLHIGLEDLENKLSQGVNDLAAIHPGSLSADATRSFYEEDVGNAHLMDLANWHLRSSDYIADTIRLQEMFASGKVLDFGGGIGTHALAAASLNKVDHVWFVDLNPNNRSFVKSRALLLGLEKRISFYRDLDSIGDIKFDTVVCLDVLEHLSDPSEQLLSFLKLLNPNAIAIMNWYFFKGNNGEYPFHFDEPEMIETFFKTLQSNFIEIFHPFLITSRAYKPLS